MTLLACDGCKSDIVPGDRFMSVGLRPVDATRGGESRSVGTRYERADLCAACVADLFSGSLHEWTRRAMKLSRRRRRRRRRAPEKKAGPVRGITVRERDAHV